MSKDGTTIDEIIERNSQEFKRWAQQYYSLLVNFYKYMDLECPYAYLNSDGVAVCKDGIRGLDLYILYKS